MESKTWKVLIDKIGLVEVEGTEDIDSAYENAMEKFNVGCNAILAVFGSQLKLFKCDCRES